MMGKVGDGVEDKDAQVLEEKVGGWRWSMKNRAACS
jgi:hypothetical protein